LSIGYRAKINNKTGEFISGTANTKIVSTKKLQPGFSVDTDGNILVGIPEFKLSLGFGVAAGAYLSINKQPSLTKFEKTLKEALKNKPKSPKEKPDGL
jgi:hypothetical protein